MKPWMLTIVLSAGAVSAAALAPQLLAKTRLPSAQPPPSQMVFEAPPAPPPPPSTSHSSSNGLSLSATVDRTTLLQSSPNQLFVKLEITAERAEVVKVPTDLTVIVDKSGSMCGQKMQTAVQAIRDLGSVMAAEDRASLLAFSSAVERNTKPLSGLELQQQARSLFCGGGTNMQAALEAARHEKRPGRACRALLLSDGLPGNSEHLPALAAQFASAECPLTTIGIGSNYDEDLLQQLADLGTGDFHWAQPDTPLASTFQQELNLAQATVAESLVLTPALSSEVQITALSGLPQEGGRFALGSVFSGQSRTLWLALSANSPISDHLDLGSLRFNWSEDGTAFSTTINLPTLVITDNNKAHTASINTPLFEQAMVDERYNALQTHVAQSVQGGDFEGAQSQIDTYKAQLLSINSKLNSQRLALNVEEVDNLTQEVNAQKHANKLDNNIWCKSVSTKAHRSRRSRP